MFSIFLILVELEVVLVSLGCIVLLFECYVLKKDFVVILFEFELEINKVLLGQLILKKFFFLCIVVLVDSDEISGVIEGWNEFLVWGKCIFLELVEVMVVIVVFFDFGVLFFFFGFIGKFKGIFSVY